MKKIFEWLRKDRNLFWVILLTSFLLLLMFRKNNLITWMGAAFEIGEQNRELRNLEKNIDALDKGIEQMNSSADAAEEYARVNLGFCAKDEDVYIVED